MIAEDCVMVEYFNIWSDIGGRVASEGDQKGGGMFKSQVMVYSPPPPPSPFSTVGVGGAVTNESALRSVGSLLSRVRPPPPASWPDRGPESL
ncbi:hypothetical protein PoB_001689600 [Plakobranchus ocellatus]|uniref:Uncharacterized protein n=1 Tax=Plakobranchus ocellatus TaxID=259542 RepID=A0AAV3Z3C4_9GAST|nr:hypothetical protein PoB_001689600 [Plakobranchus ocellatus]